MRNQSGSGKFFLAAHNSWEYVWLNHLHLLRLQVCRIHGKDALQYLTFVWCHSGGCIASHWSFYDDVFLIVMTLPFSGEVRYNHSKCRGNTQPKVFKLFANTIIPHLLG